MIQNAKDLDHTHQQLPAYTTRLTLQEILHNKVQWKMLLDSLAENQMNASTDSELHPSIGVPIDMLQQLLSRC